MLKAGFTFQHRKGQMNGLLCAGIEASFLRTDSGFQLDVSPARAFICSRNHRKGRMTGEFSAGTGFIQWEYSRTSRPLRSQTVPGWRCPSPSCVTGQTPSHCHWPECPGVSTQPFSTGAVNGESRTAGGPVQPAPAQQPSSRIFTDGCHLQAVTAGDAGPGIFPVTSVLARRLPPAFFRPEQRPAAVRKIRTTCVSPCASPVRLLTLRRHPVDNIAVAAACLRVPLLHHHPRSGTYPADNGSGCPARPVTGQSWSPPCVRARPVFSAHCEASLSGMALFPYPMTCAALFSRLSRWPQILQPAGS